jgi:hypothetical protein
MNLINRALFLIAVSLMAGIEGCYFIDEGSTIKRMAGLLWICIGISMFAMSVIIAGRPLVRTSFWKSPYRGSYLIAACLPPLLIYFGVSGVDWTPVNLEGVQQATIGVNLLQHDPDFGIFKVRYFDRYVARQYALTGLPSFWFGPSLIALRVGNSFIYVISYLAFLSAFLSYLEKIDKKAMLWVGWAGIMVSLGQYPLIQARMFEQTTMPLGATLMFIASLLNYLAKPTELRIVWVAWSVSFLTCGYTPAYGSWVFAIGVLLYLAFHPKFKQKLLLVAVGQGLLSLIIAYCMLHQQAQLQNGILKMGPEKFTWTDWIWRYFSGFTAEFNAGYSVIPAPLGIIAFVVLFFGLQKKDYRVLLVFLWCCAIVFGSLSFVGSFFNGPHYDVHRTLIILPVLSVGSVLFYLKYYSDSTHAKLLEGCAICLMIYMVYSSVSFPLLNRWYYLYDCVVDTDEAMLRIEEVENNKTIPPIKTLYINSAVEVSDTDLRNELYYFDPNIQIFHKLPLNWRGTGNYIMRYNDRPRGSDDRIPSQNPRPYIVLQQMSGASSEDKVLRAIDARDGLVLDYEFAEESGNLAHDKYNMFPPALLTQEIIYSKDKNSSGIYLDGKQEFVTLPSIDIDFDEMTIATWVKWSGGAPWQRILDFGNPSDTYMYLTPNTDLNTLRLSVRSLSAGEQVVDAPTLPSGVWKSVIITFSGSEIKLYIDGILVNKTFSGIIPTNILKGSENWIGRSRFADPYFAGFIHRLQVYNRALDESQIMELGRQ